MSTDTATTNSIAKTVVLFLSVAGFLFIAWINKKKKSSSDGE